MAQLKYTKVVACGTVAAVAGLSLAGIYLYKRRGSKKADQKKSATAKALTSEDKQSRRKRNNSVPEACNDCRKEENNPSVESEDTDEKVSVEIPEIVEKTVESNLAATNENCNTGNSANTSEPKMVVEEPCIQVATSATSLETAPPPNLPRPDLIAEDPCIVASSVSTTETTPPSIIGGVGPAGDQGLVVEEACMQTSTPVLQNGYGDSAMNGVTNGVEAESPFQVDGQQPLSFDWASSVEAAEKGVTVGSLASPTCSTHNG